MTAPPPADSCTPQQTWGGDVGQLLGAASALHGLARLGYASEAAARLSALTKEVGGLVAARAGYAQTLAAGDTDALTSVACQFEEMGAILYAAEACAEASVLLRRAGTARAATAQKQKAARLLERCEGAFTPPMRARTARARLTPAEFETAAQAAAGLSDRQTAEERSLSVRTIESQLRRTYEKLGVSGRRYLKEALRDTISPESNAH